MKVKEKIQRQPTMRDVQKLQREIRSLRSLFISLAGEDPEGSYKPEFVEKMLKALDDKPIYTYTGPGSLMKQLNKI